MANKLSELGEKIFLDRYAYKDVQKKSLQAGDTVVVCVDLKTGKREVATVEKVDLETDNVTVMLRDGTVSEYQIDHIDKPLETDPSQMFDRVASHIAGAESTDELRKEWKGKFRELLEDWKYVPGGRIYAGAGTNKQLTFYNCYVIPSPKDSRKGIVQTLEHMNEIFSRGGGVGFNISSLRPRYAYVKGVNGRSSGAVNWGSLYSFSTGLIEQGGSRRGALMMILNVWHPDILEFINAKRTSGQITNANISVGITDDFMDAVKADADWNLIFPDTTDEQYDEFWTGDLNDWKNRGGKVILHKTLPAREIWSSIIESAWTSAEPGVYFIDRANYASNSWYYSQLQCTNPCGEQPLPAWGVCNLGHINLAKHISLNGTDVDWAMLRSTTQQAVRFQDNVIDVTPYFFDENKNQQLQERRIGLGTLGLAELLIQLKLRYGSPESIKFIDKLYEFIATTAYEASVQLAIEKGAFKKFDAEKYLASGFMKGMPEQVRQQIAQHGIRNVTILTQAPTGTVGTMVGTSTGIEPFFSWVYFRKSRLGVHEEKIKLASDWLEQNEGKELPDYFVTAMELTPEEHVTVQAAIQRWMDSAISKTVNMPEHYTIEQTAKLYELMYDLGCKGGTIYRDGSRTEQVLATEVGKLGGQTAAKDAIAETPELLSIGADGSLQMKIAPRERPRKMAGVTYQVRTSYGKLYVTVNEDSTGPFEVFASLGKSGGFFASQTEAITRLISLALRSNIAISEVIDQLKGIRGPDVSFGNGQVMYSLPDAIGKVLEQHMKDQNVNVVSVEPDQELQVSVEQETTVEISIANLGNVPVCATCGNNLVMTEGCLKCPSCGYSKCG